MLQNINYAKVNYTIQAFVEKLLKKRFSSEPIKQQINDLDSDKLNFACPYCGDSTKNPNAKRGNLYLASKTYKCFNDGCSVWVPLDKFISHFSKKYELEIPQLSKAEPNFKLETSKNKKGALIEFLINSQAGSKLLKFTEVVERFGLIPCHLAPMESPIRKFIESRKIETLDTFKKTCYYDSREDKIYLFNLDLKSDRLIGFALRSILEDWQGPKYNIKNYSELQKNGLVNELDQDFLNSVNSLNNFFNILNIDFTKDITITEGQIDSMFIDNCIALTGVTKAKSTLENIISQDKTRIFFDNDSAGKSASIEFIKKGFRVFLWTPILLDLRKQYPNHNREIRTIKDVNDLYCFLYRVQPNLTHYDFNQLISQYFSNSAFDLILI